MSIVPDQHIKMAGLFELLPFIGEGLAKAAPEIADAVADGVADGAADGADGADDDGDGDDDGGDDDAKNSSETPPTRSKVPVFDMTASGTRAGADAAFKSIFNDALSFGKWIAVQAVKQAAFYAGMKAINVLFHTLLSNSVASGGGTPDPTTSALFTQVTAVTDASHTLEHAMGGWIAWSKAHFADAASYGSVTILGSTSNRYDILQYDIGAMNDMLDQKVSTALAAFNKDKTETNMQALKAVLVTYAQQISNQAKSIAANETAMVKAGLVPHDVDTNQAYHSLL